MNSILRSTFLMSIILVTATLARAAERTKTDTNREVIRTYAQIYLETKSYDQAEKTLLEYLAKEDGDPVLWNMLGMTELTQKKYAQSCHAFKKASELFPMGEDRSNALYGFADCLNQGGRPNDARTVLRSMAEGNTPAKNFAEIVLEKIKNREIKEGDALPPFQYQMRGRWRFSGALGIGYDTNVTLVNDNSANSTAISDRASLFFTPALQLGYWGNLFNQRYDARMMTSFTSYSAEAARSFNLLYERIDFMMGPGEWRYGLIQEMAFLNRDPFQLYFLNGGATVQRKFRRSAVEEISFELPLKYKYYYGDRTVSENDKRSAVNVTAKAQYLRIYQEDIRFASLASLSNDFTSGKNYRMTELTWPNSVLMTLPYLRNASITNSFSIEPGTQYYWQNDDKRRDWSIKLGAGFMRNFFKDVRASLDYSYQKNFSNVEAARYTKHLVTLTTSYDFL